jgi:alpha-L-fucosidase
VPESQQAPLRGLGAWLAANGEAVYGSRPWVVTESTTTDGTPLRFTRSGEGVYALVMGMPAGRRVTLPAVDGARVRRVRLVATDELLDFVVEPAGGLTVTLPERLALSAVTALDLGAEVRARLETGP